MIRNLENQVKTIDSLLRQKEQLILRNTSLMHINYLIEQISKELGTLTSNEIALIPGNILENLLYINPLSKDSFEMLVLLIKDIIRWKCSNNLC